ncbi:putative recombination initiation defects 3 isoform X2 [Magnolia sinica]|uniref:putative recombination initiation defects 3 isoform X2 n=1 Tax=Magnolia sinica TaxID=86752 RepID=UPI002657BB39|nr:putative recombination initiation defects 3 isoform X2 [Magnolia sinica]
MKLKINKACDLSSIFVLPPHSRRGNAIPPGADTSVFGKSQGSLQFRSHSQQSFTQGMSMSQLSQNSQEEIVTNEHRFGSQDNSLKRISCLAPVTYTQEDTQMPMSRSSNNVIRRWSSTSAPDNRCGPHCGFAMAHKSSGWLKMKKYPTVLFLQSSVHESKAFLKGPDHWSLNGLLVFQI